MNILDVVRNNFPEQVLRIVEEVDVSQAVSDEIELLFADENKALYNIMGYGEIWVWGGVIEGMSVLRSPMEIFGDQIGGYVSLIGLIIYTWFTQAPMWLPEIFYNTFVLIASTACLVWYFMWLRQLRLPTIQVVELLEVGEWGAARIFIPAPYPHSNLTISQVLYLIDKAYQYYTLESHEVAEKLQRTLTVLKRYAMHLQHENKKLLEDMRDIDNRAQSRLAMTLPDEFIEEYERKIEKIKKQYLAMLVILAILAFAFGYLISGGGVYVQPAGNMTGVPNASP